LNAHLDVVPGDISQFVPRIEDGKLYGRGAYDMKGAAAVMIVLFNELADQVDYPLGLQLVAEEELPDGDGTEYQLSKGIRTDFAIMGECGSNFRVIHETKGIYTIILKTTGLSAHGAYPWKGKNAILRMYEVLDKINKTFPIPEGETDETTVTVARISTTNETWNAVPDNCNAVLDIRYNKKDHATVLDKVKALLPEDVTMEIRQARNHHYTAPDNEHIQLLQKVGKEVLGKDLPVEKTYGGSDTTYFSNVGCDAIEFGPIGHGQHHDDEWVDIQSLGDYYKILKKFLLSVK
jgi:succinyl-diaminopimelate desuccinylase